MRIQEQPARLQPPGAGVRDLVVEMTSPIARNVLYRAYGALRGIGVQVLHTRLRMRGGDAVETLHLAEFGDACLDQDRIFEVLAVLNSVCEANVSVQQSGSHGQVEALRGQ